MEKIKFSGYKMVVCCILLAMACIGFGYSALAMFFPIFIQTFKVSVTEVSLMFVFMGAANMICNFASAKIAQKFGYKTMVTIGVIALFVAYVFLYFATNLGMVYAGAACIGAALSFAECMCINLVISNWFIRRQGTMTGLAFGIANVGTVFGAPIIGIVLAGSNFQSTCLVNMAIIAVLTIPALIMLKGKPEDIGQKPLGFGEATQTVAAVAGPSFKKAITSVAFALFLPIVIATAIYDSGTYGQITNMFTERGFDIVFCGILTSIISAVNVGAHIMVGISNDKWGTMPTVLWCLGGGVVSMALALFAFSSSSAIAFAVIFGIGYPMVGTLTTVITMRVFGGRAFKQMIGMIYGIIGAVSMLASLLVGTIHDVTGGYNASNIFEGVLLIISIICIGIAIKVGDKMKKKAAAEEDAGDIVPTPNI